ncbi:MAG: hypothetical protein QM270_00620 [Bacillota bacterium]|nr:hypothetical protein [Bacillota bacterium]
MEAFKARLKGDIVAGVIMVSVIALCQPLVWFVLPENPDALSRAFTSGFLIGIALVAVGIMARNASVLKNEDELKKLYIRENDERTLAVQASAAKTGIKIVLMGLAIAMVVAASIHRVVALTLLGATVFTIAVNYITNWIYNRRF